jgi:3-methyladenine DNA glycosylase AlkD
MPTVEPNTVIGVRMPALRKYAKKFPRDISAFLRDLPHEFYEENNLHGLFLNAMTVPTEIIDELDRFLPYVDNWATCDLINPKALAFDPPELIPTVERWLRSDHAFTVRFGIGILLRHYLDSFFLPYYLDVVAGVRSKDYYVKMMIAWFFAEALVKQYDHAVAFLQEARLGSWCHNKAIQKALESFRISRETKQYLRTLR